MVLLTQARAMATTTTLSEARALQVPSYEETLVRDPKVSNFWVSRSGLLESAWKEWESTESLPTLDSSLYHPKLREAIELAWKDPTKEDGVRDLWQQVSPGVYKTQFFDPEKLHIIREYFDKATASGIPVRAPYGIQLNHGGMMVDSRSEGYLAVPTFQDFYQNLMTSYMRPLGRLFFPEYINDQDDSQTFGFSIATMNKGLRMHSDASALTLNINMNLPNEDWEGSSLLFVDPETLQQNKVVFGRGEAVIHRGATMHMSLPLTKGFPRRNLVLWLYGKYGQVNHVPYAAQEQLTQKDRWTKAEGPQLEQDWWAPF